MSTVDEQQIFPISIELDRLRSGPQAGQFTFLHHAGPVLEYASNLQNRINVILREKPESEHLIRLRHIYFVPPEMVVVYNEAVAPAWKAYNEAVASAGKAYNEAVASAELPILALIPDCKWNGSTIFP